MLIHELLSRAALRAPQAVAVIEPGASATYAEINDHANRVADRLRRAAVKPGERVIIALENSIAYVGCYFGILQVGAIAVPLPPGARSDRLLAAIDDCSPSACILDEGAWSLVSNQVHGSIRAAFVLPRRFSLATEPCGVLQFQSATIDPRGEAAAADESGDQALAAIIYTSGSTGTPRGVMLSHLNITSNTESIVQYLDLSSADRVMVVLPFYYVYGLSLLHTHVAVGGSLVLDNRFAFPNVVLKAMQEHDVTGFAGVPSTFAMLLHKSNLPAMRFPALRYVTQAGGPMAPGLVQEWLRAVPAVPFFIMYGATEAAARLAYLPPTELHLRPGSVGRAIPNVELRVLTDDGRVAAAGEMGELIARGPNISRGYWNCPEETRERFGPDGYRTGDLGYADADGFLYLVGRRYDMIKVGAHRVSAKEIEEVLYDHPAVHEAAVVARSHELLGEVPTAHVVLRDLGTASEADILTFCRARLPEHKVPVHVDFHTELPKSGAGKIAKAALARIACTKTVA
jgi:long-chain acyl-CoA synthetase